MYNDLYNKVVIVTGVSGQLGGLFTEALSQLGAKVVGIDLNVPSNLSLAEFYQIDISDEQKVKKMFKSKFFDSNSIYGLVNNAGYSIFTDFKSRTHAEFTKTIEANLWGPFLLIREFANYCSKFDAKKSIPWKPIVNISSIYSLISPDFRNYKNSDRKNSEVYGASKAGLIQMTKYFCVALADQNIRVNAISPGGVLNVNSPQSEYFVNRYSSNVPMKRLAEAQEITPAVLFLLSSTSSYINGINLVIDGGLSAR